MNKTGSCEYRNLIVFDLFLITFFAVLLLAGSFMDERIAGALFTPDSTFVKFVTSTGVFPYFSFAVVFLGVLCKKIIDSGLNKKSRIIIGIFLIIAAVFVGFIGAGSLLDRDCLGSIYPNLNRNIPAILILTLVTEPFLILAGLFFALVIMFSRMILGAHFLSDVSFGALIGSLMALAYTVIQQRISNSLNGIKE